MDLYLLNKPRLDALSHFIGIGGNNVVTMANTPTALSCILTGIESVVPEKNISWANGLYRHYFFHRTLIRMILQKVYFEA